MGGGGRERDLVVEIITLKWIFGQCDVEGLRKFTVFRI